MNDSSTYPDVDLGFARVPTTLTVAGVERPVVAAIFLRPGYATLPAHVVIWADEEAGTFTVHTVAYDDDAQRDVITQGSYDLTYPDAVRELVRRGGRGA
jgi:hypothetical protein